MFFGKAGWELSEGWEIRERESERGKGRLGRTEYPNPDGEIS
jgi:hypothetical protein